MAGKHARCPTVVPCLSSSGACAAAAAAANNRGVMCCSPARNTATAASVAYTLAAAHGVPTRFIFHVGRIAGPRLFHRALLLIPAVFTASSATATAALCLAVPLFAFSASTAFAALRLAAGVGYLRG
eukprot:1139852-Pelagomonas_calceolata.AAC.4